jgi:hypothetical protein
VKPRNVERIPISRLAPYERKEVEAILTAHRQGRQGDSALQERYLSDYGDSSAWWIMLIIAGLGGAGACGNFVLESGLGGLRWFPRMIAEGDVLMALRSLQWYAGLAASLAVLAWAAVTWIRNHKRRGYASTGFATVRVKGHRVALVRHADVARIEWRQIVTRTQKFSVLDLTSGDGKVLTLYVHAGWVRLAIDQIDRARAAAGLPPAEKILPG